ncbi:MAG: hypothetical protein KY447_07195, partial [Actinobacteria bacterium]|nr:hypothetical protein [Actinomycetota bacterium]
RFADISAARWNRTIDLSIIRIEGAENRGRVALNRQLRAGATRNRIARGRHARVRTGPCGYVYSSSPGATSAVLLVMSGHSLPRCQRDGDGAEVTADEADQDDAHEAAEEACEQFEEAIEADNGGR